MSSSLCYFYVPAVNKEAAEKFYGSLFGWTFSPGRDNHGVKIDDVNPAGAIRGDQSAAMNSVQAFFQVENIDATINKLRQLGGLADDVVDDGPSGRHALCRDDQGTSFNLWQPAV